MNRSKNNGGPVAPRAHALAHSPFARGLAAFLLVVSMATFAPSSAHAAESRVDVNSASVEVLAELPGIGPAKAAAIAAERAKRPFSSVEDLTRVTGIGTKTLDELKPRVRASAGK